VALTILEGSTFCLCDERGDIDGSESAQGFFTEDTRFLSLLRLRVNGARPLPLSFGKVEYFSAAFYLRNPLAGDLLQDEVSIVRERFVGEGMQDRMILENRSMRGVSFDLELEFGSDFADIYAVKDHDFALGDPLRAKPLPPPVGARFDAENNQFLLVDGTAFGGRT
jgi:N-terminal domain of (some) glycogen debranching enzymes